MKIFERTDTSGWGNRLNVIDENNVVVGYDYSSSCCENFGYYFTKSKPEVCNGDDGIDEKSFDHAGYIFDTEFNEDVKIDKDYDEGGATCFRLTKEGQPDIYLVLYNHHNGCYSHGFDMKKGENEKAEEVFSGSL